MGLPIRFLYYFSVLCNLVQRTLFLFAPSDLPPYPWIYQVAFVLESGCKGMAFSGNPQDFAGKSYAERLLFNTCLHLDGRFVRGHIVLFTRA